MTELGWADTLLRLCVAALVGGGLGLNRFLHHKHIGVRTLGLIAIMAAALVLGSLEALGSDGASRAIQGIITGIGFVGAGVIMHEKGEHIVRGLTTAATVWVAAVMGALCGLGHWRLLTVATVLVAVLLLDGGRFEKWMVRQFRDGPPPNED